MSLAMWILAAVCLGTAAMLVVRDGLRRAGRATPTTRVRTGIRRRPPRGATADEHTALLKAGFAAQIIGPLLARASLAVRRCDAAGSRLELALAGESRARSELASFSDHLGEELDGVRPSSPRWHRYAFYGLVLAIDVATGLVIASGLNLGDIERFGYGASAGLFLFFVGKLTGTGLRRLDLEPRDGTESSRRHPDVGTRWVSWVMVAAGGIGIVVFVAGLAASRLAADELTAAALKAAAAAGSTASAPIVGEPMSWWQATLVSVVALGSFAATAFLAMRGHPATRRIEELELQVARHARAVDRLVRPLGHAVAAAARDLALLDAALAERAARLAVDGEDPAPDSLGGTADRLHQRHDASVALLDTAAEHRYLPPHHTRTLEPGLGQPPAGTWLDQHEAATDSKVQHQEQPARSANGAKP